MNDRTHLVTRPWKRLLLVGALAAAGWWLGTSARERIASDDSAAVTRPGSRTARPELPSLAPAGMADIVPDVQVQPRPPGEWQGMLVDLGQRQYCEASSYCGFALACLDDGACGPCQRDDQCAGGEACVLDHCVVAANAGCRTRADCDGEALCVLSGLTGGEPRGNGTMASFCQESSGGLAQDESADDKRRAARLAAAAEQQPVAPPVSSDDLRTRLDAELSRAR